MGDSDYRAGGRVDFDFEGSLELARQLWALAEELEQEDAGRTGQSETALAKWQGPYATEFAQRCNTERSSAANVIQGLQRDAQTWAAAWAAAMAQQNQNNRAAAVQRHRDDRWWGEKLWDEYGGGEDTAEEEIPAAQAPAVPRPPHFQPTATEQVF